MARGATVVAFLTTTCPYCRDSLPVWSEVHDALETQGSGVVAISLHPLEATKEYVTTHAIRWPVYVLASPEDRSALKVGGVPLTLSMSVDGEVARAWIGLLRPSDMMGIVETTAEHLASSHD